MGNNVLDIRDIIVKNINCVVEGVTSKKEATNEILHACLERNKIYEFLNSLTMEEAMKLYEIQGVFLCCGDGQVQYSMQEKLN